MTPFVLLAALALAAPVPKEKADLTWKFAKGDTYYVRCVEEDVSTAVAPDNSVTQKASGVSEYVFKLTVTAVGEKETAVELAFVSFLSGHSEYTGEVKARANKNVAGQKVTLTLDAKHQITKLDGVAELEKATLLRDVDEIVRYRIGGLPHSVPGKSLAKGEKWTAEWETPQQFGVAKLTTRGTVDGITDGVAKLTAETDHYWAKNEADKAKADMLFAYDSVKGENDKRTVWFDTKAGRVQKLEDSYTLAGEFKRSGQVLQLTQEIKVTTTVSDEKPKEE